MRISLIVAPTFCSMSPGSWIQLSCYALLILAQDTRVPSWVLRLLIPPPIWLLNPQLFVLTFLWHC